jgi:uncharacterized membrane protein
MDTDLVILHFESTDAAQAALATVKTLEAEGFLHLDDGAIISRADDRTVSVTPLEDKGGLGKPTVGAMIGLVAGGVLGLPVLGALAGGGFVAKRAASETVEKLDSMMNSVAESVEAGTAVLALAVESLDDPATVTERLSVHRDSMTSIQIPAELRAQIEGQGGDV